MRVVAWLLPRLVVSSKFAKSSCVSDECFAHTRRESCFFEKDFDLNGLRVTIEPAIFPPSSLLQNARILSGLQRADNRPVYHLSISLLNLQRLLVSCLPPQASKGTTHDSIARNSR